MKSKKIYITGCARSGTTLLRRMFYAFEDIVMIPEEIHFLTFMKRRHSGVLVGKRTWNTLFSVFLGREEKMRQIEWIKNSEVLILNILRDGKDVIESGYASAERWMSSFEDFLKFPGLIHTTVFYEDLVGAPDELQEFLAERFSLIPKYRFSEYPAFVPDQDVDLREPQEYYLRPLDQTRIGKDFLEEKIPDKIKAQFLGLCAQYQLMYKDRRLL